MTKKQIFVTKWAMLALAIGGGVAAYKFSTFGPDYDLIECLGTSGFITFMIYLLIFD